MIKRILPRIWKPSIRAGIKFPQLPDASPDPILITNIKGQICYVNPSWEKLTGYTFDEVKGSNPRFLNSGKTPKRVYKKIWKSLTRGKSFSTDEIRDRRKDGSEYSIYSTFFPIRKNNVNLFYVQYLHDITKDKASNLALRESEKKYRILMEQASDAIIIHNVKRKIVDVNTRACELLGYTKEELLAKYAYEIIKPENGRKIGGAQKNIKRGQAVVIEREVIRKDGSIIQVEASSKKITRNLIQSIIRDITEHKELDRQKDAFIGIASHELKTPITALSAYVQLMDRKLLKKGDPEIRPYVAKIKIQVDRVTELIDDLLNVSLIDAGKMKLHIKKFNIERLVDKVISDYKQTNKSHVIRKEGASPVKVLGDENRIEQVLSNLLSNAIKYSPNANIIVLNISSIQDQAVISVQDFGLGIAKTESAHVFDRFFRTKDKEEGRVAGFGLGLYISKVIINKHKGNIWVKSEKGKGSTFYFSLPLAKI